jgi:hypothetical protein
MSTLRVPSGSGRRRSRIAAVIAAVAAVASSIGAGSAASDPLTYADTEVVARYQDTSLTWKDLDALIKSRHVMSKDGRAALKHMMQSRALEVLAKENGVTVRDSAVDGRWKELESQIAASGEKGGIAGYLKKGHLSAEEFRRYLKLAIVQDTLTRRALGLDDKAPLSGEQQEIWMDERLRERDYVELPPPWKNGLAATCAGFSIGIDELVRGLRQRLPEQDIRDDCYQVMLARRMQKRLPDIAASKLDEYVQKELDRRRAEVLADPRYKGIPYEKIVAAQGMSVESLPTDPTVLVAAMSRAWVDRSYSAEALKRVYADEREYFDGLFGEAIDTWMLFLRGAQFKNDFNPRTFVEADAKLLEWKSGLRSLEDFQRVAKAESEDAATRESGGSLGYVTTGNQRVPAEVRAEVGRALSSKTPHGEGDATGKQLVGPMRLANGSVLLWLGMRRPAPSWENMSAQVHRELRKRFIDDVLPKANLITALDGQ